MPNIQTSLLFFDSNFLYVETNSIILSVIKLVFCLEKTNYF
ncbi:hypothetical protein FM106_27210 [Brachybacterium faecium]|nr:hypothetical protein FM106_27210 [Brachybacterium faecium]